MSNITQVDLIKANIEYGARGTSNKEITKNILNQWRNSEKIINMQLADKYYRVENIEIQKKTRSYEDEEGHLVLNNTLSNAQTKTARYRKSINQKANFALNKPFVISCDNDKYKKVWTEFLEDNKRKIIAKTGKQAISKGIAWVYPWIDEKGDLQITDTESETVYPAWSDTAHTKLDAIVRDYVVTEYINQTPQDVYKVEFWDSKIFQKFRDYGLGEGNGDLVDDNFNGEDELSQRANAIYSHMVNAKGENISWDRVPFIFFKGADDELPALNECKSDIDNYDMIKSKGIDSVLDDIDAVLVVEKISPELNDLVKARKIVQNSRIMTVEPDGKAYYLKVDLDINAIKEKLEILKKDIIDDTNTVDVTSIEFGSNPSGKAMRMFFEPLNIWANGFEAEFRVFMQNLKYFFDKWLSWKGGYGTFEELQAIQITFTLDRDLMIDETEIIKNITSLEGELSQETKDELNPYVESHEKEEERREADRKKAEKRDELLQFNNAIDENNDEQDEKENNKEESPK